MMLLRYIVPASARRGRRKTRFRAGVSVFPQTARHRFTTDCESVSCFRESRFLCRVLARRWCGGGSLFRQRAWAELRTENGGHEHSGEEAKQYRWLMETCDPRGGVDPSKRHARGPTDGSRDLAGSLLLSRPSLFVFSLFLFFSLAIPRVFLGGQSCIEIDLHAAARWSNSHPQWNTNDESVNESVQERKHPSTRTLLPCPFHPLIRFGRWEDWYPDTWEFVFSTSYINIQHNYHVFIYI